MQIFFHFIEDCNGTHRHSRLDIKSFDPITYTYVTGVRIEPTLALAKYLDEINKPTWIRYVLVPCLTDDPENIAGLADFLAKLNNVERVKVLPFHKMGEYKWEQLGFEYLLKETPTPVPTLPSQSKVHSGEIARNVFANLERIENLGHYRIFDLLTKQLSSNFTI